jgi:hypothetical protein
MVDITIEELQDRIEEICEMYDQGDDTIYRLTAPQGEFMLTPYNGPWTETIQVDEEGYHVLPLPDRIINKYGLKEGDNINMEVDGDTIILNFNEVH